MREPEVSKAQGVRRGKVARPKRAAVPGGKVLARLQQFEQERGMEVTKAKQLLKATVLPPHTKKGRGRKGTKRGQAIEGTAYLDAFQEKEKMARLAPAVAIPQGWRPIGPFCIPHGQTYGSGAGSRPSVAGRVSTIAIDPNNANHILAGAAGGGVWESTDAGNTWQPRTDNQPSLATGAIAFNPSNPAIVYAGTGEGDFFSRLGAGLLRSVNGGAAWTLHATTPFVGTGFYDLIVDPLDGNHLVAGTTVGLYTSANGGAAWTLRRSQKTWDLSMHPVVASDPNSTQELFAACADGVFRSTNGGTGWTAVSLPGAPAGFTRIEVCHAPSNGNVVYVFATGSNGQGYLWRRSAFGGAFQAETIPPGLSTGQAWYDWFAGVAPNNPDVLYAGAIEVHKGVRSGTGTWTWTNISAKSSGDSIHPDQHAIAFSPTDPNVVYIGNDGGVYRSPNGGTNWRSLNKGLSVTEFEYIAQHPQFEAWLIGGTQDNGTERFEGEEVWFHVQDGDGGDCGSNAGSPYTCYHTFYGMGMERSTSGGGWGSWGWIGPNPPAGHSALFYPPMEVFNGVVVQAGSSVFISTNTGTTWTSVNLPSGVATALAIASSTRIYAGTNSGNVFRVDFVSGAWQAPVALTQPRQGYVSDLAVDPINPNRLWATYSNVSGGHVYRSDNGGTSWADMSTGLPNIPANAIALDPANPNTVYLAADVGVYRSPDSGASWSAFSNLLPNALVKDLLFHQASRLLRAATQSRGVWEIAVDAATMPDVEIYLRDSVVDTGRLSPSPSSVNDPFNLGSITHWYQCTDIKVDSPSYQTPLLTDVDFEVFEDDHGVAAAGLIHENAQRTKVVRVYVQVHNRGLNPATNVAVKVFIANASLGLPNLPAGFWTNFPNNSLPASSPWQAIAPHKVVPLVGTGRSQIVGFEWTVPASAADHTCLLAVLSAANDQIATGELNIATLVRNNKKCGLKNLTVVNPPPSIGPRVRLVPLNLWASGRFSKFSIGVDRAPAGMIRGIVLSKPLAKLAKETGLKSVKLDETEKAELTRLSKQFPALAKILDSSSAYVSTKAGVWLRGFELKPKSPETIVVLVEPQPRHGYWSLTQWGDDNYELGGFTLQAIAP